MPTGTDIAIVEDRLLQIAPDAMLVVDQSGRIVQANALAERLFGYPPGTLAGRPLDILIPARLRDPHHGHVADHFRDPRHRPMDTGPILWGLRRDGSEFAAQISLTPLPTPAGPHVLAAVRDVSDHRRIQQALEQAASELEQQVAARNAELLQANAGLRQQIAERAQAETALRGTEALYRQLVENQPDLICRFLPDTTLTFVNVAYAQFFGRRPAELIGQRFIEFLCAEEQAEVRSHLAAFTPAAPARQYEHKTIRADGVARWHLWHDFAFFDEQDKVTGLQSVGVDITGHKQTEARLRTINRALQLRSACNQALVKATDEAALPDEICRLIVEMGGYRLAWVGLAVQDKAKTVRPVGQAGYQAGYLESIRITWADEEHGQGPTGTAIRTQRPVVARILVTDPHYTPWRAEAIKRGYASLIALPLCREQHVLGALNIYAGEADAFDAEEIGLLTELADDVAYGLSALRVRAERQQMEVALQEGEERFRQLAEAAFEGIAVSQQGRLIDVSKQLAEMLGYTPAELIGREILDFVTPEARELVQARLQSGNLEPVEHALQRKDGSIFPVEVQVRATLFRGEMVRISAIRDITERKRAEDALRASEEKYRLLVDHQTDLVVKVDPENRFLFVSPSYCQVFGKTEAELLGKTFIPLVHEEDRESTAHAMEGLFRPPYRDYHEQRALTPAGWRWFGWADQAVLNGNGQVVAIVGVGRDITERKQAEEALHKSEERLTLALRAAGAGAWEWRAATNQAIWSDDNYRVLGLAPGSVDSSYENWLRCVHPDDQVEAQRLVSLAMAQGSDLNIEFRVVWPDGSIHWLNDLGKMQYDLLGNPIGMYGIQMDVTERKRAEEVLFEAKERAQVTLHSIGDAVITTDARAVVEYLNPVAEAMTGWSDAEARGRPLSDIFQIVNEHSRQPAPDPVARCLREGRIVGLANHTVLIGRQGREFHIDDSAAPIRGRDGQVLGVVLVFHDVTEYRQLTRQLEHDATHDALTGLINRAEFERRLARALASAQQYDSRHALCYLDLDQFKVVNDTAGHAAGDELLRQINTILSGMFRERDTLARIGGDEFGLLLDNCPLERAQLIAQTVVGNIRDHRFHWEGRTYQIGVSIGLTPITAEAQDTAQLLTQADVACYIAKELGRNRVHLYQREDTETVRHHSEILGAAGLRDSLEQGRFRLHYQPIISLSEPAPHPTRHEVLLRVAYKGSPDANTELVLPAAFIPAAERYGLMGAIDRWVIQTAFHDYAGGIGRTGAQIAINLSGNSLSDETLLGFIEAQFAAHAFPPDRVCFEITETAAIQSLRPALELMAALKRHGSQLALDDFGSGLSSFRYLKTLPIDYLKIDGSFVKDMVDSPNDCALVAAINQMSHTLGIQTVAEYAENQAIVDRLRELGVDYGQGFFFGHAAPWGQHPL